MSTASEPVSLPSGAREFVGHGPDMPAVSWPDGARVAVSLVVNYEEGSERTPLYGDPSAEGMGEGFAVPPGTRDLRNESHFDYGSRVGHWRILEILNRHRVAATYFACGMALELNPEAAASITASGHEVAGHGYRWLPLNALSAEEEAQAIADATAAIEETTGERPTGWFSRGPTPRTRTLLQQQGYTYDCDAFSEDLPYTISLNGEPWTVVPYAFHTNDMKYLRPPGYSSPDDFYYQLRDAFDRLHAEGASQPQMMSIGLHLRHTGRPERAEALDRFLTHATACDGVWFARRREIAQWWRDHYGHLRVMRS